MSTGKIQFAEQNGSFVLKFVGEVPGPIASALGEAGIQRVAQT